MVQVACYKICTVQITRRPGSTDAEGFPLTSSSSTGGGMERTASLVLPSSPVRDAASRGVEICTPTCWESLT